VIAGTMIRESCMREDQVGCEFLIRRLVIDRAAVSWNPPARRRCLSSSPRRTTPTPPSADNVAAAAGDGPSTAMAVEGMLSKGTPAVATFYPVVTTDPPSEEGFSSHWARGILQGVKDGRLRIPRRMNIPAPA
jgi:hypothetical protein